MISSHPLLPTQSGLSTFPRARYWGGKRTFLSTPFLKPLFQNGGIQIVFISETEFTKRLNYNFSVVPSNFISFYILGGNLCVGFCHAELLLHLDNS